MRIIITGLVLFFSSAIYGQDVITNKTGSKYVFNIIYDLAGTAVKDQCKTATCWSFSTLSMLESELIRTGKGIHDLSEMYVVRWGYVEKAINYIRMNGKCNFEQGGEGHDIPYIIGKYGIVPEEVYRGLDYGQSRHNHDEMLALLQGMMEKLKSNPGGTYTKVWIQAVEGVLDAYLGKVPRTFQYKGKEYTPQTFAASLGLNMDDYKALTSFTHHPYNKPFTIEVPDNWSMQQAWNVTPDELTQTTIDALKNGYTVAWAADVSEKGFSFRDGLGIIPVNDTLVKKKGDDSRFFNDAGAMRSGSAFDQPYPEKQITAELRQDEFDRQLTTDDHGMHITGLLTDQNGTRYFKVKNSWGTANHCGGYLYVSEAYFRLKTISIMLHKDAIDKKLKQKTGL
ncbi:MAG: aminopeptidase C [Sphingomonadales bacterium]|jgi:bleomycin hydrolase